MKETIDLIYPVGRTIICDHSPQTDYPWQTWVQDFKDVFPLGAGDTYTAGATGGEAQHTLTYGEMPNHSHDLRSLADHKLTAWGSGENPTFDLGKISADSGGNSNFLTTESAGSSMPHNNMPPYKAVKYWTRTA